MVHYWSGNLSIHGSAPASEGNSEARGKIHCRFEPIIGPDSQAKQARW